jgi:hypothetical protein
MRYYLVPIDIPLCHILHMMIDLITLDIHQIDMINIRFDQFDFDIDLEYMIHMSQQL